MPCIIRSAAASASSSAATGPHPQRPARMLRAMLSGPFSTAALGPSAPERPSLLSRSSAARTPSRRGSGKWTCSKPETSSESLSSASSICSWTADRGPPSSHGELPSGNRLHPRRWDGASVWAWARASRNERVAGTESARARSSDGVMSSASRAMQSSLAT